MRQTLQSLLGFEHCFICASISLRGLYWLSSFILMLCFYPSSTCCRRKNCSALEMELLLFGKGYCNRPICRSQQHYIYIIDCNAKAAASVLYFHTKYHQSVSNHQNLWQTNITYNMHSDSMTAIDVF